MAQLEVTTTATIPAPPERVWELVSDTARYAEWVEGTLEVTRTDGPAGPGSTYEEVNPLIGPWKARTRWTVTEFEPPRRQVHSGEGVPIASELRVTIELLPAADATELTLTLSGTSRLGPVGALMTNVLRGQVARDNRKTVQNLVDIATRELQGT